MAEERLKDELAQITEHIQQGRNFLLSGGAGSGKTYTLVEVVRWIIENYPSSLVACITYTNAAVKEIAQRVNHENFRVSTIHDFLWDNIKNYQKELCNVVIKLLNTPDSGLQISGMEEIPADYYSNREKPVGISYQEHTNLKEGILSHDEVIIVAHEMFKEYPKLSDILKSRYPFVMIDEYQDTFPMVVEIMLSYLKQSGKKCIIECPPFVNEENKEAWRRYLNKVIKMHLKEEAMKTLEFAVNDMLRVFHGLAAEGRLPEDVKEYLHQAWKEIEDTECYKDYGMPRKDFEYIE